MEVLHYAEWMLSLLMEYTDVQTNYIRLIILQVLQHFKIALFAGQSHLVCKMTQLLPLKSADPSVGSVGLQAELETFVDLSMDGS